VPAGPCGSARCVVAPRSICICMPKLCKRFRKQQLQRRHCPRRSSCRHKGGVRWPAEHAGALRQESFKCPQHRRSSQLMVQPPCSRPAAAGLTFFRQVHGASERGRSVPRSRPRVRCPAPPPPALPLQQVLQFCSDFFCQSLPNALPNACVLIRAPRYWQSKAERLKRRGKGPPKKGAGKRSAKK
jgi:hypothetical protein